MTTNTAPTPLHPAKMLYPDGIDDGDLYGLLGVHPAAAHEELVQGRRLQAKQWHPDRNPGSHAQARMAAINNAFRVLSDATQRQAYDQTLRSLRLSGDPSARPPVGVVTLASYFRDRGFSVVDNRLTGGVLWVVDGSRLEPAINKLREQGIEFEFAASGGMATGHRPAWWTRAWG
ncbi:MAG: J domain-containing protein [Candidatus Dormibacteria bacterium]